MNEEFLDLYDFPDIEKVVDGLFFVLNTESLDKLDGIDDILKDTLQQGVHGQGSAFCGEAIELQHLGEQF